MCMLYQNPGHTIEFRHCRKHLRDGMKKIVMLQRGRGHRVLQESWKLVEEGIRWLLHEGREAAALALCVYSAAGIGAAVL